MYKFYIVIILLAKVNDYLYPLNHHTVLNDE